MIPLSVFAVGYLTFLFAARLIAEVIVYKETRKTDSPTSVSKSANKAVQRYYKKTS